MNFSELERIRVEKIERMRARGIEPYPTRAEVSHTTVQAIQLYEQAESAGSSDPVQVSVGGRLRAIRTMGKVTFAHIEDGWGRLQLFFRVNELGEAEMERFRDDFDLGDFIQASGVMFRTRSGEITLHVHAFKMLSKAITPLPAAKDEVVDGKVIRHAALTDPETRYRQRYADLAVNPEVREVFRIRARAVKALRDYLDNMGFLEVETPILQPIYGGAAARPFVTYHNQLKQNLYLRISFELYLKRLLVGMLDRVYEIGRDFRNEGVSYKHNPEFTQLEFYMAYADYLQVMEITEQMVAYVAQQVLGTTTITYEGHTIDLTPPWRRLELRQGILETTGIDIDQHPTAESLAEAMRAKGMQPKPGYSRGKLIDSLLGDYLEPTLIQPTFLYNYPRDISPLAKSMPGNPLITERFEGYIGGMELCNAFTELNDPLDQEQRFLEMGRDYNADDEERHPMDEDYLRAMSYGMPPCGGFGMGIDRLVMLLADRHTIREVILFPHLREEDRPGEKKEE
ncbi:lysine--tRNA ligase [Anaerolinea thermophila]|uniref:Lysine--tRNA ligase n=2 Tax=Anaerolinea TaxID=233189 RepID=E8N268_ANATU|nr:lysine--tRNA ligase [Anaerolinea thermophila]BAJ65015.1 lysyl-tRNA synthetase [Anaerolinea thermophila UNI-1]